MSTDLQARWAKLLAELGFVPDSETLRLMGEDALAEARDGLEAPELTPVDHVASRLLRAGLSVVRAHDAPLDYDLMVCRRVKVRVLGAVYWTGWKQARFTIGTPECDVLALVIVDSEGVPSMTYYLPRAAARGLTMRIGPGSKKLEDYAENLGVIMARCG